MRENNFIRRSIMGALAFFKGSIFAEEYALKKGFLQSLDPRAKVFGFSLFLLAVLFAKNIFLIGCIYLLCLLLSRISGIDLRFFLKRTWVFIPLFSLFIAIPALFSTFTPGEPLFIFRFLGRDLVISRPGLSGAVLFVLRVLTSVSLIVLLSLTTRHNELLKVLRVFRIPQVFVMTLGMCYRYIYLFVEIIENTYLAIRSRTGGVICYKKGQSLVAGRIANLWQRSAQLNEQVYYAMLSRGYTGEPAVLEEFRFKLRDWLWLSFCAAVFILAALFNSYLKG